MDLFSSLIIIISLFSIANGEVGSNELPSLAKILPGVLPEECGEVITDRIIGGSDANLGQYPWIAQITCTIENCTDPEMFLCGGSLITKRHIITAAHCITDMRVLPCDSSPGEIGKLKVHSINLGVHDTKSTKDCSGGFCAPPVQRFKVLRIVLHPKYNTINKHHDIAVMEMDKAATFTDFVSPICLPFGLGMPQPGKWAEVAGWGLTNLTKLSVTQVLQRLSLQFVTNEQCAEVFKKEGVEIDNSQLCAGGVENKDTCSGDSGGPLMMISSHEGTPRQYLMGVVSFGNTKCGTAGAPAIYTNVQSFIPWILQQIQ